MDPFEYPSLLIKTIWKENQLIDPVFKPPQVSYYMVFGGSLLYFLTFFMSSTEPDFFNMLFNFISFLMLLAIIISQSWFPHIVCTIFTSLAPLMILSFFKDNIVSYLGCYMIIPQFILLSNSNLLLYCYTSLMQFYFLQFKLKECIPEICRVMNSHSPFDKFLEGAPSLYFFFMASYGIMFYFLRKRVLALEHDKKEITGLYEQHQTFTVEFSHELRNPINSLLSNLQFVMQEKITEKANNNIQAALLSGETIMQLINNILDSGKLKAGKLEILPVPTKIHDLSQRVWMMFSELIKRKELTGTLRIDKRIPTTLQLDPHRIIQILFNLVSNAIKFTNRGEIMISFHWVNQAVLSDKCFDPIPYDDEDEGIFEKNEKIATLDLSSSLGASRECYVLTQDRKTFHIDGKVYPFQKVKGVLKIVVKDTGAGMDKKAIETLFQKYGQAANNAHCGHGTGLGLYLVSEICKKMEGSVKAYSKVGKGTTFIACIPTQTPSEQVYREDKISY